MRLPAMIFVMRGSVLLSRATSKSYSSSASDIPSCLRREPDILSVDFLAWSNTALLVVMNDCGHDFLQPLDFRVSFG